MNVIEITSLDAALGDRLKLRRIKANFNQAELASRVGLSRASISNIENGRQPVTIQTLWRIAQALGLTLRDLVPDDSEILPPPPLKQAASTPEGEAFLKKVMEQAVGGSRGTP